MILSNGLTLVVTTEETQKDADKLRHKSGQTDRQTGTHARSIPLLPCLCFFHLVAGPPSYSKTALFHKRRQIRDDSVTTCAGPPNEGGDSLHPFQSWICSSEKLTEGLRLPCLLFALRNEWPALRQVTFMPTHPRPKSHNYR